MRPFLRVVKGITSSSLSFCLSQLLAFTSNTFITRKNTPEKISHSNPSQSYWAWWKLHTVFGILGYQRIQTYKGEHAVHRISLQRFAYQNLVKNSIAQGETSFFAYQFCGDVCTTWTSLDLPVANKPLLDATFRPFLGPVSFKEEKFCENNGSSLL